MTSLLIIWEKEGVKGEDVLLPHSHKNISTKILFHYCGFTSHSEIAFDLSRVLVVFAKIWAC